MSIILQDAAMVCIHLGCEVIFTGPSQQCPCCGWQGVTYREIEAMATTRPLDEPQPKTIYITIQ